MPANARITAGLTKPTMVVGRIMTLDDAERIVADGAADMISMVRALIADPELVNKSQRGDAHLVRPCIGSNIGCVGQLMSTGVLSCVVNVSAAQETAVSFEPPAPAPERRRVLVVGGGPGRARGGPHRRAPRATTCTCTRPPAGSAVRWRSPPPRRTAATSARSPSG